MKPKNFDPKKYHGIFRIYLKILSAPNIQRLWSWNENRNQYEAGSYYARRYEIKNGNRKRVNRAFSSLEDAKAWQAGETTIQNVVPIKSGILFETLLEEWRTRQYPNFSPSTRQSYEKLIRLYLHDFMKLTIHEITSKRIDEWIDWLKHPNGKAMSSTRRKGFAHELSLLSTILKYYESYHDDDGFRFPIKGRHKDAVWLNRPSIPRSKNLSEDEFFRFRDELENGKHGSLFRILATVQYFQALRISEAAGLYWEDFKKSPVPEDSLLRIVRKVEWIREKGSRPKIVAGFKNSEANNGFKEQPIFPEVYEALLNVLPKGDVGPIFHIGGELLTYRQIQHAYDAAFKRAGLEYSATHILRHGGCRRVYNEVPDPEIAKQLLGNTTLDTTLIYAKRDERALKGIVKSHWAKCKKA